jgi:hypothetical protein
MAFLLDLTPHTILSAKYYKISLFYSKNKVIEIELSIKSNVIV